MKSYETKATQVLNKFDPKIIALKSRVKELQALGLVSLKAGTEWEDMDYFEIQILHELSSGQLPLLVKIAGPEAKVDLRHLQTIGAIDILGPMIESEYALEKFVTTVTNFYDEKPLPSLAINLETIQSFHQLDNILNSQFFDSIDMVVIGRLDLSLSMHKSDVDHAEVGKVTQALVNKVRKKGKSVSIGGFVNPGSAIIIKEKFYADRLNTLHTLFNLDQVTDISGAVWKAIEFEIAYYQYLQEIIPQRSVFYETRIQTSQEKLDKSVSIMHESAQLATA